MDDNVRNEEELNFYKTFYTMVDQVENFFSRLEKLEKVGENASEGWISMHGYYGGDPPPYPSKSESSSSSSHHHHRNSWNVANKTFFKLDVKFDIPMYNGESNAEKLRKWIRHIELYCRIQQIVEEEEKIQLSSLWLNGTTLIWWERKLQGNSNLGNLLSSWSNFIAALKDKFYALGYKKNP